MNGHREKKKFIAREVEGQRGKNVLIATVKFCGICHKESEREREREEKMTEI